MPLAVRLALAFMLWANASIIAALILSPIKLSIGLFVGGLFSWWLFTHIFFQPLLRGEGRKRSIFLMAMLIVGSGEAGIRSLINFLSDTQAIFTLTSFASAVHLVLLIVVGSYTCYGLLRHDCDHYFSGPRNSLHPYAGWIQPLLIVLVLGQMSWQIQDIAKADEIKNMKPTFAQIILRDVVTKKFIQSVDNLPSKSAPHGWTGDFTNRHGMVFSAESSDGSMYSMIGIKTAIAEPLVLCLTSKGYEPGTVIIKPGHEGRIELDLNPVISTPTTLTK